jgi:small subunit ribosomal protein S17
MEKIKRKIKNGTVVSNKMNKTVVVSVDQSLRHPQYGKVISISKKYYAHYEGAPLEIGAKVEIIETRPLSKLKRWRVATTEKASVA